MPISHLGSLQDGSSLRATLKALSALAVVLAAALPIPPALAQPPGAAWRQDPCQAKGAPGVQCLRYPQRIQYHKPGCQWVSEAYAGGAHAFEICRDHDGVWRPSGRS